MNENRPPTHSIAASAILLLLFGAACGDNIAPPKVDEILDRSQLRWRRVQPLLADFSRALELDANALCRDADGDPCGIAGPVRVTDYLIAHRGVAAQDAEAVCAQLQGGATCSDDPYIAEYTPKGVHVFALGGNEPFTGTFAPLASPGLTTPLVLDRVALLACGERVKRDAEGTPVVFQSLDLSLASVGPETPGFRETVADLYHRLLARDASPEEIDIVVSLATPTLALSGRSAARLACFVIATTTEVLFQ